FIHAWRGSIRAHGRSTPCVDDLSINEKNRGQIRSHLVSSSIARAKPRFFSSQPSRVHPKCARSRHLEESPFMPFPASARHRRATILALAIATALVPFAWAPTARAQSATASVRAYAIPEQALADAVRSFGRQSQVQVVFRSDLVEGRRSRAVQGQYSPAEALDQLLQGSGLRAQQEPGGTWTLQAAADDGGVVVTDTLKVGGRLQADGGETRDRWGYDDVFALDLSTAYSGRDRVERYRGANPADVVKDLVGVFSGDARNSGALDLNIRGIQGPGRVPVSIDGGEQ